MTVAQKQLSLFCARPRKNHLLWFNKVHSLTWHSMSDKAVLSWDRTESKPMLVMVASVHQRVIFFNSSVTGV